MIAEVVLVVATAFCLAAGINGRLADSRSRWFVGDRPNERSMHASVVARTGGIGLLAGWGAGWGLAWWVAPFAFSWLLLQALVPVFLLAVVSGVDDRRNLSARIRLVAHLASAALGLWLLGISGWLLFLLVFVVGWSINLYNFMDGLDGLAGGAAVVGFGLYALAAAGEDAAILWVVVPLVAATFGFLYWNRPPARIFLGDVGSTSLGYLAAMLGIAGAMRGLWPWWFPAAAFPMLMGDASVTLVRRFLRREVVWKPHRQHLYQRLVLGGWSPRRVSLAYSLISAATGIFAWWGVVLGAGNWAATALLLPVSGWVLLQLRASSRGYP